MDGTAEWLLHEINLITQCQVEPQAFGKLYDHYFGRVYTYIRYRVSDDDIADDLTALVFEQALRQIHRYDEKRGPFAAWLFGIARNTVGNHLRHRRRWKWFSLDSEDNTPAHGPSPEEALIKTERHDQLLDAVKQLPEREQDIIALKYVAGITNRDIARLTGLSESNVSVIVYRSLQKLRITLNQEDDSDEA